MFDPVLINVFVMMMVVVSQSNDDDDDDGKGNGDECRRPPTTCTNLFVRNICTICTRILFANEWISRHSYRHVQLAVVVVVFFLSFPI